ncbi:hypothetical protein Dsin_004944 [Dipteronia sinensis]|uniref:Ubiquitin-like protease family profile domain-containing protein n=1 Tax=Dipteronia sinensis TaxID=43782 RepID=A0AAE0EEQ1_9ROSI|nr:hypothetical protein Dsin_004944 [Dipteronia sinensis]
MPWTVDVSGMRDDSRKKGADVHTVETYNIYGLAHALLVFTYEVILEFGTRFGTRREIDLSPRMLKWELNKQPRSDKLDKIFIARMFARTALGPTAAERVARYYEGIYEGGSLYMAADRHDGSVLDPLHHTTPGPSYTEGSDPEFGGGSPLRHMLDTEGSNPEFVAGSPLRHRHVRFAMLGGVHSREEVGGHCQDRLERKIQDVMDAAAALLEDLRKSDQERDRQHREVMDFLRGRRGPATGPTTEGDGPQTQGPRAGDTVRDQQMQVPGGTDTRVFGEIVTHVLLEFSLLMEVQHVDPPVHIQDHTADPSSPLGQSPSFRTVYTPDLTSPRRDPRGQSSSSQHPIVVHGQHMQQRIMQQRICKRGWQLVSPYTNPCQPKRPRTLPLSSAHTFRPNDLVDADQFAAYQAYKRNVTGEFDVDLMTPVPVTWFHRSQTNFMELEDMSMLEFQWRRIMPPDAVGSRPWHEVDAVLIPCNICGQHWLVASVDPTVGKIHLLDPFRQEVPLQIRKEQVASLRWFLPSMLYQVGFHDARSTGEAKYEKRNRPFGVSMVSTTHMPQQTRGGNCGAHTLRLMEYVLANRETFDWSEDDMCTIREKIAMEIFCNSKLHYML